MAIPSIQGVGHGKPVTLFGHDGTNWYAVLVDSSGQLQVDIAAMAGFANINNRLFGYNDTYAETETDTASGSETLILTFSQVPSGEVWVVTHVCLWHTDTTGRRSYIRASIDGTMCYLAHDPTLAKNTSMDRQGWWVLKEDDYVGMVVGSVADGEDANGYASGFKMKIG